MAKSSRSEAKHSDCVLAPLGVPAGVHRQLVIDASDSPERWSELLRTIEELARLGETIDCSRTPLVSLCSSTALRQG